MVKVSPYVSGNSKERHPSPPPLAVASVAGEAELELKEAPPRRRVGLFVEGPPAREGAQIYDEQGKEVIGESKEFELAS